MSVASRARRSYSPFLIRAWIWSSRRYWSQASWSIGLTLLMLTPELAGRADLREGCPYGKAEKVHAGVPSGGGGAGAGYGSADRARGRGDRRGCATAGSLGPAGTRAARSASEPGDAFDRPGAGGAQTAAAAGP